MQGIGTGGSEYIVMIVAYALLAILFVALTLYKWRKERTGIVFTVFETYVVILELFFACTVHLHITNISSTHWSSIVFIVP